MLSTQAKTFPATTEDSPESEGADSNRLSGSVSSFLANEKLMSFDSANSDLTGTPTNVLFSFFFFHYWKYV